MKRDKFKHELFKQYKDGTIGIEHYEGCQFENRLIPVSEAPCTCYEEVIFTLGTQAQIDLFYEHNKS